MNPKPRDKNYDWEAQVGVRRFSLRPRHPRWAMIAGYVVSQVVGLGALAVVTAIFRRFDFEQLGEFGEWASGILAWSQFFLIPFAMGVVASYFWFDERELAREANDRHYDLNGSVLLNTVLMCIGAFSMLFDDVMGFFMALPILIVAFPTLCLFMWWGSRVGFNFWRKNPFFDLEVR